LQKREILDPVSGSRLGEARWNSTEATGLLQWLLAAALLVEVHETEDDSLLFTMSSSRRWRLGSRTRRQGPSVLAAEPFWQVRDADEHLVGRVQPHGGNLAFPPLPSTGHGHAPRLLVAHDRLWRAFVVAVSATDGAGKIWGVQSFGEQTWTELGCLSRVGEGMVLEFSTLLEGQPFSKMLLLAEALIIELL
jgi:hypothetical protein